MAANTQVLTSRRTKSTWKSSVCSWIITARPTSMRDLITPFFLKKNNKKKRNNQIMSTTLENVLKTDFDMEALQARPRYEVIRAFVCPLCLVDKPPLYWNTIASQFLVIEPSDQIHPGGEMCFPALCVVKAPLRQKNSHWPFPYLWGQFSSFYPRFCFDREQRLPLCCRRSWPVPARLELRVTRPPGCKCVSQSCAACFLTSCCSLTGSIHNINCWICHPLRDHMWGYERHFEFSFLEKQMYNINHASVLFKRPSKSCQCDQLAIIPGPCFAGWRSQWRYFRPVPPGHGNTRHSWGTDR